MTLTGLDPNSVPYVNASHVVSDLILTNGQLLIGKTSNAPVANTLTGTANEVIVTNRAGTITLSTPQDIATRSSPTFVNITVNNINGKVANDLVTGVSN